MNKSVNSCDDFYGFVCGNWESRNPAPKYEPRWTSLTRFTEFAKTRLRDELESEPSLGDIFPIQYVKKLYKSCMDNGARESEGLQKISAILQEADGWPMTLHNDTWNSEATKWQEINHYYGNLIGIYAFFTANIPDNPSGPTRLTFTPPVFPLTKGGRFQRNYPSDDIEVYRSVIKNIARLFIQHNKENVSDDKLEEDVDDLLKFEETVSKALTSNKNVESVSAISDYVITDFIAFWNGNVSSSSPRGRGDRLGDDPSKCKHHYKAPLDNTTWFEVEDTDYFIELERILDSTKQRIIVNYIHWNFLRKTLPYITDEVNDIFFQIIKHYLGIQERRPGWLKCVREIEEKHAAAYLFVRKYYPKKSKAAVDEMMRNLKKSFEYQINNSNWLPIEAKEAAIMKVNSVLPLVGHPKWYNNETALIKFYQNFTIGTSYFENMIKAMKCEWLKLVNRWGKFMKLPKWTQNVLKVNGRYSLMYNAIRISGATLQSPRFGEKLPDYITYGTAGITIAHEMGHGFDTFGSYFGATTSEKLFADDGGETYREHVRCFVRAFDRYFENATENSILKKKGKQSSRGEHTLNENLADWLGVQAAFHAYKEINDKGLNGELKLPGLEEFTGEQMFFISYAHNWCAATKSETFENIVRRDSHSPNEIRVIGTVSNTLEFAEAFNCPKNSPMNPERNCNVWTNSSIAL